MWDEFKEFIFLLVKVYSRFRKDAFPPPPTPSEILLAEIRDLLSFDGTREGLREFH